MFLASNGTVRRRIIEISDSDSDCDNTGASSETSKTAKKDIVILPNSKTMKNSSVLEKENQMKYLMSSFPKVDTMVRIKTVSLKCEES